MERLRLSGHEARAYRDAIAALRVRVFWDFPYLYEGELEYEKRYLETYFKAKNAFVLLMKDGEKIVGATTGIHASEEEEDFSKPFSDAGLDPSKIFYFGESVLLPEYRGQGFGKIFFEEREAFARSLGFIDTLAFCAVVRPDAHPLKPQGYSPLDPFWKSRGFVKADGITTEYTWLDRGETRETPKLMQYWLKSIAPFKTQ